MIYLIALLIFSFLAYKLIDKHTHDIEINREEIYNNNIKEEIKILHLSDLHFNFNKEYQEKLLEMINNLEYDLLVFTGDYINKKDYIINLEQFLKGIQSNAAKYAVFGNHDHEYNQNNLKEVFKKNNIEVLINEGESLKINEQDINLIGIDTPDLNKDDFSRAISDIELKHGVNILLSHTYHIIEKESLDMVDLVLVGDTHGGQINLPIISDLLKNNFALKYVSGKYILNHLILLVNRGIGYSILPLRINCKPEMLLINLNNHH
jgi:hypothetical protein